MLAVLGLPVAVALAWVFEQTPDGLKRTEPARPEELAVIMTLPTHRRWPAGVAALLGTPRAARGVGGALHALALQTSVPPEA